MLSGTLTEMRNFDLGVFGYMDESMDLLGWLFILSAALTSGQLWFQRFSWMLSTFLVGLVEGEVILGERTMTLKGKWLLAGVLLIEHFYEGGEFELFVLILLTQRVYSSLHNVCIEHLWRDVSKDSLQAFWQISMYLEEVDLVDMENPVYCMCLYLVFHH
jgi:hypothetical protein